MYLEYLVHCHDTMRSIRKEYRFPEEDIEPKEIPDTLGELGTLSLLLDALISEVRFNLLEAELDPLFFPDPVHKELNALIMSATLDMDSMAIHNLSNIERKSEFTASYENRVLTVSVPMSFINVKVFTNYKINAGAVVISEGRIMGRVGDISFFITLSIDFGDRMIKFQEFGIPKCESISVSFKGEGLSKFLLNVLTPIVILAFKSMLLSTVKVIVSQQIEDGLKIVNRILKEIDEEHKRKSHTLKSKIHLQNENVTL